MMTHRAGPRDWQSACTGSGDHVKVIVIQVKVELFSFPNQKENWGLVKGIK